MLLLPPHSWNCSHKSPPCWDLCALVSLASVACGTYECPFVLQTIFSLGFPGPPETPHLLDPLSAAVPLPLFAGLPSREAIQTQSWCPLLSVHPLLGSLWSLYGSSARPCTGGSLIRSSASDSSPEELPKTSWTFPPTYSPRTSHSNPPEANSTPFPSLGRSPSLPCSANDTSQLQTGHHPPLSSLSIQQSKYLSLPCTLLHSHGFLIPLIHSHSVSLFDPAG